MHLTEHNIVEKIQHAFEENDNKAIAKTTRFVADNLADTVRNPHWKRLNADVRAHVLEKAILYKDAEKEEESGESDSGKREQTHKPQLEFFQQKEGLSFWRMFLKNTGNCRIACRLMVKTSFSKEMIGEPRFLDIDDVWELEDAKSMHFFKDSRKFTAEYVAVKQSESSAEKLLEIEALNKSLQLEITD